MKVKFNKNIVETYEKELEMEKTGKIFPRAMFGSIPPSEIYKLAKNNKDIVFSVSGVEENKILGRDYDKILIQLTRNYIIGVRRKFLVEV